MNKKLFAFFIIVVMSGTVFSGCSLLQGGSETMKNDEYEQKNSEVTLTGMLSKNGDLYFVTDSAGALHDVETYSVSFDEYVGKSVTVSGQYSGNTLFVTEISL